MLKLDSIDVKNLLKKMTKNDEFEIMFNNFTQDNALTITQFHDILKFMKVTSTEKKIKLEKKISLDIVYSSESFNNSNINYRISINGLDMINNIINLINKKTNNEVFSIVLSQFSNDNNVSFIRKERKFSDVIDFNTFDIRVRKSSENSLSTIKDSKKIMNNLKNLPYSEINKIIYRYKQRISLVLIDNTQETLLLDSTITQMNRNINEILNSKKKYEVELDLTIKNNDNVNPKILDIINEKSTFIKKVLSKSDTILSKDEANSVLTSYKNIAYGSTNDKIKYLYSMQPISAEVSHIVDNIPNSYSTTDKADGDKTAVFIYNGTVYLLSNNLSVTKTSISVEEASLEGTLLEGEFIFIKEKNKYLLMLFDCLFDGKKDMRIETDLKKRLAVIPKILNKINNNKFYNYKGYSGNFNLKNINKYYLGEITEFYKSLNNELDNSKKNILLFPKLFIHPFGAENSEAFSYGHLIWNSCTENQEISCPYSLDGLIYTGVSQKYTNDKREQKFPMYKYKPPENNSIDVYVRFKKNSEKGSFLEIFDDSLPNVIKGTKYRVCELMVGESVGNREVPVPFMPMVENHEAYFPVTNGIVRDIEGNAIMNNTVIELAYNKNSDLPHKYRWIILRSRWDKTESVNKYQKRYGNYKTVAEKTWKSMKEAVTIEEIKNLAEPSLYLNQRNILISRIDISKGVSQDKYYELKTSIGKNMRQFANWIKSIIIYTYCRGTKINPNGKFRKKTILDIGSGRGGDILKFFHARVAEVVGIDPDYENVYSSFDSSNSRYKNLKGRFPQFPKMTFIQGDGGVPFTAKAQKSKILNYSKESEKIIDKVIGNKKFDIINSSMAIHYLFKNENTLKNLLDNIKKHLNVGGYVLLTLFDCDRVMNMLDDNKSVASYYTDDEGRKNKFFEIVKKFDGKPKNAAGNSIDVHMSWINADENSYNEEYLVPKEFMISSMKSIGLKLVDSNLFQNMYTINKDFFDNVIQHEENPGNKKFYQNIAQFFKELKGVDKEGKKWQFLYRYYIFQLV